MCINFLYIFRCCGAVDTFTKTLPIFYSCFCFFCQVIVNLCVRMLFTRWATLLVQNQSNTNRKIRKKSIRFRNWKQGKWEEKKTMNWMFYKLHVLLKYGIVRANRIKYFFQVIEQIQLIYSIFWKALNHHL